MPDVVDRAVRSRMMSGIRGSNTRPEIFVRRGLHRLGFRFRLHARDIPGRPDIVLPKYNALIIVNGCFWHGHDCRYFKKPKSNSDFWISKITSNIKRDACNLVIQRDLGWRVLVIWECAIRGAGFSSGPERVIDSITKWLRSDSTAAFIDETGLREGTCFQTAFAIT